MNNWTLEIEPNLAYGKLQVELVANYLKLKAGAGKPEINPFRLRKLLHRALNFLQEQKANLVAVQTKAIPWLNNDSQFIQIALQEANYIFTQFQSYPPIQTVNLSKFPLNYKSQAILEGIKLAKDLINAPPNLVNPEYLVKVSTKMETQNINNLSVKVLDRSACQELGLNAFLAVAQGASSEPYLLELTYQPPDSKQTDFIGLLGKAITYDTGGLSLKPNKYMYGMHSDMAGAATVLGIMHACLTLKVKQPLKALILACENSFGGASFRPGDIIKAHNGRTIEIIDTDAEGRLTLADGLSYLSTDSQVKTIIDYATLTGSCLVALGSIAAGAFTNSSVLLTKFREASELSGEPIWPLPLYPEFSEELAEATITDLWQCTTKPDACLAAAFLQYFLPEKHQPAWLHLDIAGTAFLDEEDSFFKRGATGRHIWSTVNFLCRE